MKLSMRFGLFLALAGVAHAADPPVRATRGDATAPLATVVRKPLNLRIGHIRDYMMPAAYRAALEAPDADKYEVVVEGARAAPALKSTRPIPSAIAAPFWAIIHPTQAWRIFAPDLNAPPAGPPVDKVPPPIFRWGP